MANKIIHGVEVEYDENSSTIHNYLGHLENSISHEEMRDFMENAKHNPLGKTHLEDNHGNKITLEFRNDNSCLIRKRQL